MRALVVIGEDLGQLTRLAASLSGRFRDITIVHTDDVIARTTEEPVDSRLGTVVCLASGQGERALIGRLANLAFVVPAGRERDELAEAGAACFDPDCEPFQIAEALAPPPRLRRWSAKRRLPAWPAARAAKTRTSTQTRA